MVGWTTVCAWICILTSSYLYPAQLILGLVSAAHPNYVEKAWHVYLLVVAIALSCLTLNLPRLLKSINYLLMCAIATYNLTALYLLISLLVRATPKQKAVDVFVTWANYTGWSSNGFVFFLGILPGIACLGGFDNVTHLTDELETPTKSVPQVMVGNYLLSFGIAVPMIIVYQFCNVNPESSRACRRAAYHPATP